MKPDLIQIGDIVFVHVPFSDAAEMKQRPALVLTTSNRHGDAIVAAITSQPGHAATIKITNANMVRGALPKESWVRTDKLHTINLKQVKKPFGAVQPAVLTDVRALICPALGCS